MKRPVRENQVDDAIGYRTLQPKQKVVFSFFFDLPADLPSVVDSKYARIEYCLTALALIRHDGIVGLMTETESVRLHQHASVDSNLHYFNEITRKTEHWDDHGMARLELMSNKRFVMGVCNCSTRSIARGKLQIIRETVNRIHAEDIKSRKIVYEANLKHQFDAGEESQYVLEIPISRAFESIKTRELQINYLVEVKLGLLLCELPLHVFQPISLDEPPTCSSDVLRLGAAYPSMSGRKASADGLVALLRRLDSFRTRKSNGAVAPIPETITMQDRKRAFRRTIIQEKSISLDTMASDNSAVKSESATEHGELTSRKRWSDRFKIGKV